jgi:hypothetical protein
VDLAIDRPLRMSSSISSRLLTFVSGTRVRTKTNARIKYFDEDFNEVSAGFSSTSSARPSASFAGQRLGTIEARRTRTSQPPW